MTYEEPYVNEPLRLESSLEDRPEWAMTDDEDVEDLDGIVDVSSPFFIPLNIRRWVTTDMRGETDDAIRDALLEANYTDDHISEILRYANEHRDTIGGRKSRRRSNKKKSKRPKHKKRKRTRKK